MAAQVMNGITRRAVIAMLVAMMTVLVRAVIVATARVRRVRLRFAMAKQDRQRRSDALQRHHGERRGQYQFFQPK